MEFHEVANIFPILTGDEYRELRDDIATNGLLEPIWTYQGKIIDGRNRYIACSELGIEPKYREWSGQGSLISFVVSMNLKRRHLTSSQRAVVALDVERQLAIENPPGRPETINVEIIPQLIGRNRDIAAKIVDTNPRYIQDAKKITEKAPDLLDDIRSGEMTIPEAKREMQQRLDPPKPLPLVEAVFSAFMGGNEEIIPQILQLYLPNGGMIADPTWGEGVFWSRVDREKYQVIGSDIVEKPGAIRMADFRALPYSDCWFDAVVFDPPYKLTGTPVEIDRYRNQSGGWRDVFGFYEQGILECYRILKNDGVLIVKCMDQVVSGKQVWFHRIIFDIATALGAQAEDLIVMVRQSPTPQPHERQVHAWKNHSYFWVFRKGSSNGKFSGISS